MGFTTFLVDDDAGVLNALSRLLRTAGYEIKAYRSPQDFLAEHDLSVAGCAVLDVTMPGIDGLELQEALTARGVERPIIFLTGNGDIPTSVRAMKAGAVDFLTKPVDGPKLLSAVRLATDRDVNARRMREERQSFETRLAMLTPREEEVLHYVVAGQLNKQIAWALGTVEKTIKVHRSRMMAKLGLRSVAELVRITEKAGIEPRR